MLLVRENRQEIHDIEYGASILSLPKGNFDYIIVFWYEVERYKDHSPESFFNYMGFLRSKLYSQSAIDIHIV